MKTHTIPTSPFTTDMPLRRREILSGFLYGLLGASVLAIASPSAQANRPKDAGEFLISFGERALIELQDSSVSEQERESRFRRLLNEGFDIRTMGKFILGRYWRSANEAERKEFFEVFEEIAVQRFLPIFEDYSRESFTVVKVVQDDKKPEISTVLSKITQPKGQKVEVNWRVRNRNETYQVLDVAAEGVSMLLTLRSEYNTVIKNSGGKVEALIKLLRKKVAEGAFKPDLGAQ